MLLPNDILAQLEPVVRARWVIVVFACTIIALAASAAGQTDLPDVKRWSERECIWLYRQVLPECKDQHPCSETPDFSMSTSRGLEALEPVWTVRNGREFEGICIRVCTENAMPSYSQFKKDFCSTIRVR